MKRLIVYAGINGAGKSTLCNFQKREFKDTMIINIDNIVREIGGDWRSFKDFVRAGRIAIDRMQDCLENDKSLSIETTNLSITIMKYIEKAREKDYHIEMNFIGVGDVNLSLQRIDHRVNIGGHGVSEALVRRRYERQFEGLKTAINICDWAWFYDNEVIMRAVAIFEKSKTLFLDQETKWVKAFTEKYAIEKPEIAFVDLDNIKKP